MKRPYPVFMDIENRPVLVVGGGPVAVRKAERLAACGAAVTVIAPEISPAMRELAGSGAVRVIGREYEPSDIHSALAVVVAATGDPGLNEEIARLARSMHVLANSADPPDAGDVTLPSVVTQGALTLAISTAGISPALARKLRKDFEDFVGEGYGPFLEFLSEARERVKTALATQPERAALLGELVDSGLVYHFRADPDTARAEAERVLGELLEKYAGR